MAQIPSGKQHAKQIKAGVKGRKKGHSFEAELEKKLNAWTGAKPLIKFGKTHHFLGDSAEILVSYIAQKESLKGISKINAWWLGGIATGSGGATNLGTTGLKVGKSKSDVVLQIVHKGGTRVVGVGVKTCNKKSPTNAQVFFTTASAFSDLVSKNVVKVPKNALESMRSFCGDVGFRPQDLKAKTTSKDRFFWEELPKSGRSWWETNLGKYQDEVTELLLKFAYQDDPIPPDYLLHQTSKPASKNQVPISVYRIEEFIKYSRKHNGFNLNPYRVLKGSARDPNIVHQAPRFGFIQFQRGGQKQHPTQLQFNLKAGYFKLTP